MDIMSHVHARWPQSLEEESYLLDPELQMVVSNMCLLGTKPRSSEGAASAVNPSAITPAPKRLLLVFFLSKACKEIAIV